MKLERTKSSIVVSFVTEGFPKGKHYTFNNAINTVDADQLALVENGLKALIDGSSMGPEVHSVEVLMQEVD